MNHITIHGRLVRDPETRTAGERSVTNFTVAVNRRYNRDLTDFFECSAWGKTGEFVSKYFEKGQEILVSGDMQSRKYQAQDGTNRIGWSVNVEQAEFCGSSKDHQGSRPSYPGAEAASPVFDGAEAVSDDDMPF